MESNRPMGQATPSITALEGAGQGLEDDLLGDFGFRKRFEGQRFDFDIEGRGRAEAVLPFDLVVVDRQGTGFAPATQEVEQPDFGRLLRIGRWWPLLRGQVDLRRLTVASAGNM